MISKARQVMTYAAADWLSTSLAVLLFNIARYHFIPGAKTFYSLTDFLTAPMVMTGQILFPLGMLVIYYMSGYYSNVFARSRVVELTTTLATAAVGALVIIFVALVNDLTSDRTQDYRTFIIVFGLLFFLVYIPRLAITTLTARRMARGAIFFPTAIVGLGTHPDSFTYFNSSRMPQLGFRPVMNVSADGKLINLPPLPGSDMDGLAKAVANQEINRIIVLPHPDGWEPTLSIINRLYTLDIPIFVLAKDLPSYLLNQRLVSFTADPLIDVTHSHMSASTLCTKRAIDIAVSAIMTILLAIPVGVLALAVRLSGPGPAFFRQERVGRHRKPFIMYKLRTMVADAEPDGRPRLSSPGDKRITPLGAFLRKYRLDELPQFYNVLRGDMSLVGPRPERLEFVNRMEAIEPSHALLHRMRPGITSLAMVKYGYASSLEQMVERMRYDIIYLQNVSILSDIKIMLYTFVTVFSGKGI